MRDVSRWSRGVVAAVLVAVAMLALVASSARAGSTAGAQKSIACPLVRGVNPCCGPVVAAPQAIPCCALPTPACCPGPSICCSATPCTPSLSITVAPDPATDGGKATITGKLTGGTVAAQPVSLWERLAGKASFSQVAQKQTGASGAFTFVQPVQTNAEWYARTGSVVSSTMHELVRAVVILHVSKLRPASSGKLKLSGSVAPSHAGERVALERLWGSRWVTVVRPKLGAKSRFAVMRRAGHSVERFRVVLAADARNARSVSAVVAVSARG